jgi:hypothetical protein
MSFDVYRDEIFNDVLVVHVNWENHVDYDYDVSTYTVLDVVAKDQMGNDLRTAYMDNVAGTFNSESKFDEISEGSQGRGDWAFVLEGNDKVRVIIHANYDANTYSNPPLMEFAVKIENGKASASKISQPFAEEN